MTKKTFLIFFLLAFLGLVGPQATHFLSARLLVSRLGAPVSCTLGWSYRFGELRLTSVRILRKGRVLDLVSGDLRVRYNPLQLLMARSLDLRVEARHVDLDVVQAFLPPDLAGALGPGELAAAVRIDSGGAVHIDRFEVESQGTRLHLQGDVTRERTLNLHSSVKLSEKLLNALPRELAESFSGSQSKPESSRIIELSVLGSVDQPHLSLASDLVELDVRAV